ncbi:MAG: class A beta-lactamase [Rudaea sp.]|uniref:class A beta-lactamase n=1 Tax=Rudaea sp. TaxID=2136325 RepID=UPI0039E3B012
MKRFRLFRSALAAMLAAMTLAATAAETGDALQRQLDALAQRAQPGTLGVAVLDLRSGRSWRVNADRAYPMMSVFKAPLGAAVLERVDRGELCLAQLVTLTRKDLYDTWSPVVGRFAGESAVFTVRDLLDAAVSQSDNVAADALLGLVGGPAGVTTFLRAHGIEGMRVDRGERAIAHDTSGLAAHADAPPPDESAAAKLARERRGHAAYLADPRDKSTPDAAADFLRKLWRGELASRDSTQLLIEMMTHSPNAPDRLKTGVPSGAQLAHKTGSSGTFEGVTAAHNDIGIIHWPDGRAVVVAAFLTASHAVEKKRDAIFATLAREAADERQP